ncbi:MAG: 1-acyl-sn-glycerol-3-phosphate acyltransferase [Bdellovibrionales bacterium]|nr:1-acyl-sn-glycerol-3-phosphate acyltransferase [Bdellovibrionales bacterium]
MQPSDFHEFGKSHPIIRFEKVPTGDGAILRLDQVRQRIQADVVRQTLISLQGQSPDNLLGEALYSERARLRREKPTIFTRGRYNRDRAIWSEIQAGLLKPVALVDRNQLVRKVLKHYVEEITGRFSQRVYNFTTNAIPFGMNYLLNAATVNHLVPWKLNQSLQSRLQILGEIPHLQRLSQKGTVLMVPTHQSNIDSILIGYIIYLMQLPPFAYGAGLNLFSNPVLSFFMGNLGAYTVDRKKNNAIYKETLKNYSTRMLREGIHSIFFPGGGRSRSGAIETKVKLGLLGTGLEAMRLNLKENVEKPNIYVVPLVMSYHFVLEASSLIEDYLLEAGKGRYLLHGDPSNQFSKVLNFFWQVFSANNGITVRVGKPMDIFGNFVDEDGRSIGPNGTTIDPKRWLMTRGEFHADPQRDHEYTRELGSKIVERFHRENTAMTSHLVAFAFFETLRSNYPDADLFKFLRISLAQRSIPYDNFLRSAEIYHQKLMKLADQGKIFVSDWLMTTDTKKWVEDGIKNLGIFHGNAVLRVNDGEIYTEDMNLLYYYRNRLAGYGLESR